MKNFLFFILTFTCAFKLYAQSNTNLKEMVKKIHQNFIEDILAEDYQRLSEILSDDLTLGTPNGGFETKQYYISVLKNGTLFYDSSANHSFNV